jgi:hypothetical protein
LRRPRTHAAERVIAVAVAVVAVTATTGFRDGPPARVTGGFGEDDCTACHYADMGPPASGRLTLGGLPARFTPGETYRLELLLEHAGMVAGGFQLAIRHAVDDAVSESPSRGSTQEHSREQSAAPSATQAGSLSVPDDQHLRAGVIEERGIQFAQHRLDGAAVEGADPPDAADDDGVERVSWSVLWTAPESALPVFVHAALVAGDGDESQIGDAVYLLQRELQSAD